MGRLNRILSEEGLNNSRQAAVPFNEGEAPSYMAVQNLRELRDHADHLLSVIEKNTPLDDWVSAKITEAAVQLRNVNEFISHGSSARVASWPPGKRTIIRLANRFGYDSVDVAGTDQEGRIIQASDGTWNLEIEYLEYDDEPEEVINARLFKDDWLNQVDSKQRFRRGTSFEDQLTETFEWARLAER